MADLFGQNNNNNNNESEEMNSLLQNLLHRSFPIAHQHAIGSSVGFDSGSDPTRGFMTDARYSALSEGIKGKFSAEDDIDGFDSDYKGAEASEEPSAPRRSAKRTRAAEVHNLSEKRRRSRINEKMKALQKLIPNSNKTDKASMLDEAIEYLKQLQLQVQMLSMRNGVSLYPFCSPGPQAGIGLEEHELLSSIGGDTFSINNEITFDIPNNQPNLMFPLADITDSKASFGPETSMRHHFGPQNHLASSKVSQLQLDMKCSGANSSSGVSL